MQLRGVRAILWLQWGWPRRIGMVANRQRIGSVDVRYSTLKLCVAIFVATLSAAVPPGLTSSTRAGAPLPTDRPLAHIAFIRAGDVYTLETATGIQTRLTDDGINSVPQWSADGSGLFFSKGQDGESRQTWRWRPDTGVEPVQSGLWSPGGDRIAFAQTDAGAQSTGAFGPPATVWVSINGQAQQITPAEANVRWWPLAWFPDNRTLALAREVLEPALTPPACSTCSGASTDATIWTAATDASPPSLSELSEVPNTMVADSAQWSPDGQFILVAAGPDIPCASCRAGGQPFYAVPASGGPAVQLGTALHDANGSGFWAASWAPDDSFVVMSTGIGRETYMRKQLVRFDPTTGAPIALTNDPDWADNEPAVSPDGSEIAFARGEAETLQGQLTGPPPPGITGNVNIEAIASRRIWLMQAGGSGPQQLTDAPGWIDEQPVWTPDGQWIIFVRWHPDGPDGPATAELWAVRPDGSDAQPLVTDLYIPMRYLTGVEAQFNDGFGFYGYLGWQNLFAVAP